MRSPPTPPPTPLMFIEANSASKKANSYCKFILKKSPVTFLVCMNYFFSITFSTYYSSKYNAWITILIKGISARYNFHLQLFWYVMLCYAIYSMQDIPCLRFACECWCVLNWCFASTIIEYPSTFTICIWLISGSNYGKFILSNCLVL